MKTIVVLTNDSKTSESNLTVSGNVEKFATITPSVIQLKGKIGEDLKSVVKIIPEGKYPFAASKISAQDGKNIKYELKEEKSASGSKEYSVTVENLKKDAGFYYDVLILQTDSKIQPEIKINVMARIIDPNAPANTPLTGSDGNMLIPGKNAVNGRQGRVMNNGSSGTSGSNGSNGGSVDSGGNGADTGKGKKNFLEVIQQMQQQNQTLKQKNATSATANPNGESLQATPAPVQDPKRAEELKKKFEALIKQAQEKKQAEKQQKAE